MRTRRVTAVILALSVGSVTSSVADENPENPERGIVISVGEGPLAFGRPVAVRACYENRAKGAWVVPTPTESPSVRLCYRPAGSREHPQGYSLGRATAATAVTPDGAAVIAFDSPVPKSLTIPSGQPYCFDVPFERDWTGEVVPGVWTVWLEDDNAKVTSNRLEVRLVFTADSIAACLEIAGDRAEHVYKRKEHAKWLREIMPGLELQWWADDTPSHERERLEAGLQRQLGAFRDFWRNRKNTQAIEGAITRINRAAATQPLPEL